MEWDYKGIKFIITTEPQGPFYLAAARAPQRGPFVRIRPFSALGTSEEKAIELVKEQIEREFKAVPAVK